MARIKKQNEPLPRRKNVRGRFVIAEHEDKLVVQAWPKPSGPSKRPSDFWWRATWGTAAQMAAKPHPLDQAFAELWAANSRFAPRDLLTLAALGQLFEITLEDGTKLESVLRVPNNPQAILDLVTNTPGSMLFRTSVGWVAVPPGTQGDQLHYFGPDDIGWQSGSAPTGSYVKGYTTLQATPQSTTNWTSGPFMSWLTVIEDALGAFDPATPTLVTVPAGVTRFELQQTIRINSGFTGGVCYWDFAKRISPSDPWTFYPAATAPYLFNQGSAYFADQRTASYPVDVGNQIATRFTASSDTSVTIAHSQLQLIWY